MVVNFANVDYTERPVLIISNARETPLGVLGNAKNTSVDIKYNEVSTLEFELPERVDGVETAHYDAVLGMRIVELKDIGRFTLVRCTEHEEDAHRQKVCKGYSLEYEFAYKKISLPQHTYKFWDEWNPKDTLLGMIMELMPSWNVGDVDSRVVNKYRTFKVSNENVYNFIKGTVQESYNCIFDFNTLTRTVNVRDAAEAARDTPVYISGDNLAKAIELDESAEDIVTRLDVNGAEGVDIRDVNPCGTNKIINLGYYMTLNNFTQELIDKYSAWKALCDENRLSFYSLSVRYTLKLMQTVTEEANLVELRSELTSLENVLGVVVQAMAQNLATQIDLDETNANLTAKRIEIAAKESEIEAITAEQQTIFGDMETIRNACSFEGYFSTNEYKQLDRYIKDDEITEASFVVTETESYSDVGAGSKITNIGFDFHDGSVTSITAATGTELYDIRGGQLDLLSDGIHSAVISATVEVHTDNTFVLSAYLGNGTFRGDSFPSACVSITGTLADFSNSVISVSATIVSGFRYFTLNASEYEKRSVAWELYEYGASVLDKLSQPTYTFNITSANFFSLGEFTAFKNGIALGEKVYVQIGKGAVLRPIFIGVRFAYDDLEEMELSFSDSFVSSDSTFKLVDLLEKSVAMGKTVELSKYIYSSFMDSGASTELKEFITSAFDVAKNAVLSSTEQAISWDGSGFRLRKWANEQHTAYELEQIWMINNSIVMTDDNWATAKMALGKFHDDNLGDCWGIVAPRIVGTLLAGESLIIESTKRDGGVAVFRMDGDGCRLYNSDLSVCGENTHIVLNPSVGLAIGTYPVYDASEGGAQTINEDNAKFWADSDGNLHLKGTLHAADGSFRGRVTATELKIATNGRESEINDYVSGIIDDDMSEYVARLKAAELRVTDEAIVSTVTSSTVYQQEREQIYTDMDTLIGHRLEILSDTVFLSEAVQSTSLRARVWHGNEDITDAIDASRFVWTRASSDSMADTLWNNAHIGMKTVIVSTSDVLQHAQFCCSLIE